MKIIEISSMRRAGHHAFVNWLISNLLKTTGDQSYCEYKHNLLGDGSIMWINEGEINYDRSQQIIEQYKPSYIFITNELFQYTSSTDTQATKKVDTKSLIATTEFIQSCGVTSLEEVVFIREFWNNFASLFSLYPFYFEEQSKGEVRGWLNYYKLLLKTALSGKGVVFDKWIQNEEYSIEVLNTLLQIEKTCDPLSTRGTQSSFGNNRPSVCSLLNRKSQVVFPKWFLQMVEEDEELATLLVKFQIYIN